MVSPAKGDFPSIPLNDEGRRVAGLWDPATVGACQAYVAAGLMRTSANATFIADAIDAVRAKDWDGATLTSLRTIATDLGRLIRDMAAIVAADQDD